MLTDSRGLVFSAADQTAVDAFDAVVGAYLRFGRDTGPLLKRVAELDPDMAMAHVLRGYFFHLMGNAALLPRARRALDAAEAGSADLTRRERMHVAALAAWCDGDLARTVQILEETLIEHPRDILALKIAHFIHFYTGEVQNHRDSVARVLYAWDESVPGYGYVLGMRAFGLEEAGEYAEAERLGRRAVAMNPDDAWAGHAVAHVMEMQGRHREGIAWIEAHEPVWEQANNFAFHLWWHRALYHLALEQHDAVLDLYDRRVRAEETDDYLDIANATSLLLRLDMRGVDVGDRWHELADKARARVHDHVFPFIDAHFMMALARTGDRAAAENFVISMRAWADAHREATMSPIVDEIGLTLCEAVYAYGMGDHAAVVDLLMPVRYRVQRVGGSHAQRDVFQQMLVESALRAGRAPVARALLAERRAAKPFSPAAWKNYARALEQLGDAAGAAEARRQAAALLAA
ncbi:MAG: tetratricopeptide repeat protein [Alphaproteobacteria bacterium]